MISDLEHLLHDDSVRHTIGSSRHPYRLGSIGHFYPYGQEKPSATTNGTEKFTGYLRDAETGLDYAVNRYHNPGTGRFLTPDPYMAKATSPSDPKNPLSWNRYTYTLGDPINGKDSLGLFEDCDTDYDGYECVGGDDDTNQVGPTVNYTNSQIVGYDSEGNPIVGGTGPQVVTVNSNGTSETVTFNSATCPSGQLLVNGACDVPLYGWLGNGQQVLTGVANNTGQVSNPCTMILFYGASAGAAATATVDGTAAIAGLESHGVPATKWLAAIYALSPNSVVNGLRRVGNVVQNICDATGRQPGTR